jgi:hypothetical protein
MVRERYRTATVRESVPAPIFFSGSNGASAVFRALVVG